ncbi:MAG: MmgE/PrpD family protein [Okeania sp. SIO2C9]|uniref:MmgE/PrpD family protein n=1 Tax=Okeania sp. SIO2C9 TaxID=2607791 RepID=UPI0013C13AD3|nr:MmgE/PrpD family protein [Okeania sp. SIO2C9]NEQ76028.1 MmgE/PrpD family protein [Okeania sp. SIO2C9]
MQVINFIHQLKLEEIPEAIQREGIRSLIDTLGAAIIGHNTKLSHIVNEYVVATYGGKGGFLWLDGREVSLPAAVFANGMTTDAMGIYGGHPLARGTAGATLLATLLTTVTPNATGKELLTSWIMGFEIAFRAGIALNKRDSSKAHTACTWNIIGSAAIASRLLSLSPSETEHALGIAEYVAPVAPIPKTVGYPTMVRTGAGWAAMEGVTSALLARQGFTGAPTFNIEEKEVADIWDDLGQHWQLSKSYYKPYTVCRWMQAGMDAALVLRDHLKEDFKSITSIKVHSFAVATKERNMPMPKNTEEAQFNLKFAVAAILVYGELGRATTFEAAFKSDIVAHLYDCIETIEEEKFTSIYPNQRFARVIIKTYSGMTYDSGDIEEKWASTEPPTDEELKEKFRALTKGELSEKRATDLEEMVWNCISLSNVSSLLELMNQPSLS